MSDPLLVRAARIVTPDGVREGAALFIENGRFVNRTPTGAPTLDFDGHRLRSDAPASWPGRPRAFSGSVVDQETDLEGGADDA